LKIDKIELAGFRGLIQDSFPLQDLTVFSGDMGSGKTSKLLAMLYCLTGFSPATLTLDDLINVNSDFMWVKATASINGEFHHIERRKKRKSPSSLNTDIQQLPHYDERMYIEGRQIASLFVGATAEKALRIDAMLGLADYNQIASEITILPVERKVKELQALRDKTTESRGASDRIGHITSSIQSLETKLRDNAKAADALIRDYLWAQSVEKTADEARKAEAMIQSKKSLLENYKKQRAMMPRLDPRLEDQLQELEAKHEALQRRITFLEAAMQTLDIEGKRVEDLTLCPLCGALLNPNSLSKFKGYDEEYRRHLSEIMTLKDELAQKREEVSDVKKSKEKHEFIVAQINDLENEIASLSSAAKVVGNLQKAREIMKRYDELMREKRELEIRKSGLVEQKESLLALQQELQGIVTEDLEGKIGRLEEFLLSLKRIKSVLLEALNESRKESLERIRGSFKSTFRKIYPYERFVDVDFDTQTVRNKEVMIVKAMVDGKWITSSQMSTGENVALSFALLYAINELEKSPILLMDEPEEGLDENGVRGLADVLRSLSIHTQIIVATRSQLLARLLS
jgi:DNA repair exonuclease SbcCD ATPase subunit